MKVKMKRLFSSGDIDQSVIGSHELSLVRFGRKRETTWYIATVTTVSEGAERGLHETFMGNLHGKPFYGYDITDIAVNVETDAAAIEWAVDEWRRLTNE